MAIDVVLQTTGALISLIGEIQSSLGSGQRPRPAHERIVTALRTIYFTPAGTLTLLERLAQGKRPSPELVEITLTNFNDFEYRVHRSLEELENLFGKREVSLRAASTLREIAYGKRRLRA